MEMVDLHMEVIPVQILFSTIDTSEMFAERNGKFPDAPAKCPHKGCHAPVKLRKHGFYKRYLVLIGFSGIIYIRRYLCLACGRTVSMLPSFCLPHMQYGVEVIIMALLVAAKHMSAKYVGTKWPERPPALSRRHIIFYRKRVILNRVRIQFALNMMSPEFVPLKQIAGDSDWTQNFLKVVTCINPPQFNAGYHNLTGHSFMSLHNKVA